MIVNFSDQGTKDIFNCSASRVARKTLPLELHGIAKRKLNMMAVASQLVDLRVPPANRLEKLKGSLSDHYSIRINDQWRIVFRWDHAGALDVHIRDYH